MVTQRERARTAIVLLETIQMLAEQLSAEGQSESLSKLSEQIVKKCQAESKVQLRRYDLFK
ncbi:hypothetical protein ACR3H8_20250 [Pseudomonas aeruginosa]|uniref:hypothetical protein n=1 Tax=Pseudomonas aeruginosa group TaxID=136841 RepID=UPI0003BB18E3|nr:hypothetical protein [Pseudomonas aeruginosa]EIU2716073.1 hypothetical protein [Pseudomonas aeruginosa]EIU2863636.1 hypothetical protein [Pseudomonas aeruginosa]ELD5772848.1 hypothetical protein [Pseudomonas aeruginosa]ERW61326.1 hypothetical protein Q024_06373 [Pseudomonas aeruginosa BWHPSA011]ETV28799.1 hypothetical protein Q046_05716 [Pseudomonas aeruginosa BWHPSA041]